MGKQAIVALVAAGVAVWAITKRRNAAGSIIDLSGVDFSSLIGPPQPSAKVQQFAQAIARAEGFYIVGSLPQRLNNPGDLKVPGTRTDPASGLTVFESIEQGWQGLYRQLGLVVSGNSANYRLSMTIRQMGNIYAPAADRNLPGAWAQNVAGYLGVSVDTPLFAVLT
jgi:hypothetical protein